MYDANDACALAALVQLLRGADSFIAMWTSLDGANHRNWQHGLRPSSWHKINRVYSAGKVFFR